MIRFACPGCDAAFTVGDEKAGKTGKCPKCSTQFLIPAAPAAAAPGGGDVFTPPPPVAPPPPAPVNDDIEIAPCPGCKKRLTVVAEDLGQSVECPFCETVYTAQRPGASPPEPPRAEPRKRPASLDDALSGVRGRPKRDPDAEERPSRRRRDEDDEEEEERPSRRQRRDSDDDEDRPSRRRRPALDWDDDEDDRPSRRRRRRDEDDDDEDDRPSRRRRRRSRQEPHRSVMLLVMSIVFFVLCVCWPVNIVTLILASIDLGKMGRGEMDPSGKGLTIAAIVIATLIVVFGVFATIRQIVQG